MSRPQSVSFKGKSSELPRGYDFFRTKLHELTGIDLTAYKDRQMVRRLKGYLERVGIENFYSLAKVVEKDPDALEALKQFLTINVSEFFRNPERFVDLQSKVLPALLNRFHRLNIWSAGCSIGAEPYSVSILLEEKDPLSQHEILATDLDENILQVAKAGVFREELLKHVAASRRRFFQPLPDGTWKIDSSVKNRVTFRVHDLLSDPYPSNVHLILCRNVVIYFTDEAKRRVYKQMARALVPGGYLMVGSTESIFNAGDYGLRSTSPFVYQKEGE